MRAHSCKTDGCLTPLPPYKGRGRGAVLCQPCVIVKKKAYMKAYRSTPEAKAKKKVRDSAPDAKAKQKAYITKYQSAPDYKARRKAYVAKYKDRGAVLAYARVEAKARGVHNNVILRELGEPELRRVGGVQ